MQHLLNILACFSTVNLSLPGWFLDPAKGPYEEWRKVFPPLHFVLLKFCCLWLTLNQREHAARSRRQVNPGWLTGNTSHTQNCRLQVYEPGGFSVLMWHENRTDDSILFYINQKKMTKAGQAVLVQLNGRIKWVNKKGKGNYNLQNLSNCQPPYKIKKLIIYCTDKSPKQKKKCGWSWGLIISTKQWLYMHQHLIHLHANYLHWGICFLCLIQQNLLRSKVCYLGSLYFCLITGETFFTFWARLTLDLVYIQSCHTVFLEIDLTDPWKGNTLRAKPSNCQYLFYRLYKSVFLWCSF